jgi:HAD superfamily hydrolase (TIGR01509 family)
MKDVRPEPLKAVLFDSDGVVFNSERMTNIAFVRFLKDHGIEMTLQQTDEFVGLDSIVMMHEINRRYGTSIDPQFYVTERDRYYIEVARENGGAAPIAGLMELLDWLDDRAILYAIATGGSTRKLTYNLEGADLYRRFAVRVTSTEIEKGKPEPDLFLEAAKRLEVDPRHCLVIEDSIPGLKAGRTAGATPVALTTSHSREELEPHADHIFENHHQVLEWLKRVPQAARRS